MKHTKWIVLVILTAAAGLAQQPKVNIAASLTKLQSPDWHERYSGYSQLISSIAATQKENVRLALLDLLDRENHLIESTNRDEEGPSVDDKYGEEYGEYVDQLGHTVDSLADWNDQRQVCILVYQAYEWDGQFAAKIATHAKTSIPCLIQMYGSDVGLTRAEAAPTLVRALAAGGKELDPETARQAREIVLRALQDPHEAVRSKTVRSLGRFGGPDMIPWLSQVAQSDPVLGDTAAKAIFEIQKRAAGK